MYIIKQHNVPTKKNKKARDPRTFRWKQTIMAGRTRYNNYTPAYKYKYIVNQLDNKCPGTRFIAPASIL